MGHQRQQAEQQTCCDQQNGQELRELNSEKHHVRFPAPRVRRTPVDDRTKRSPANVRPQTARIASIGLSGAGHPLQPASGAKPKECSLSLGHTQYWHRMCNHDPLQAREIPCRESPMLGGWNHRLQRLQAFRLIGAPPKLLMMVKHAENGFTDKPKHEVAGLQHFEQSQREMA